MLAIGCAGAADAASTRWARVYASHDAVARVTDAKRAADYGMFQWLEADEPTLARLRATGIRVVESDAPFVLDLGLSLIHI